MNLSELRELLQNALGDINVTIGYDDTPEPSDIEQHDNLIKLLAQLPERGKVIIDSQGMTVVPFEVGDKIWGVTCDYCDMVEFQVEEIDLTVLLLMGNDYTFPLKRCFPTREEAEKECQRRNHDD